MAQKSGGLWQKMFGDRDARTGANRASLAGERLDALRSIDTRYANTPRRAEFCPDELSLATSLKRHKSQTSEDLSNSLEESDSAGSSSPTSSSTGIPLAERIYRRNWNDESPSLRERDRQSIRRWFSSRKSYDEQAIMDRLQPVANRGTPSFEASRQSVDYDYMEVQAAIFDPDKFVEECQYAEAVFDKLVYGADSYAAAPVTFDSFSQATFYGSECGVIHHSSTFEFGVDPQEPILQPQELTAQLPLETRTPCLLLDSPASQSLHSKRPITLDPLGLSGMLEPSLLSGMGIYQSDSELDNQSELDAMPPLEAIADIPDLAELLVRLQNIESTLPLTPSLADGEQATLKLPASEPSQIDDSVVEELPPVQSSKVSLIVTEEIVIKRLVVTDEIEIPRLVVAAVPESESEPEVELAANAVSIKVGKNRRKKSADKQKVRA
jgi:hypothetical protein